MASTDVVMPVSLPTSAGTREVLDLGYPLLNLQKLDDPKAGMKRERDRVQDRHETSCWNMMEYVCDIYYVILCDE